MSFANGQLEDSRYHRLVVPAWSSLRERYVITVRRHIREFTHPIPNFRHRSFMPQYDCMYGMYSIDNTTTLYEVVL